MAKKSLTLAKDLVADFSHALYNSHCPTCRSELEWTCSFDADGSVYYSNCCGIQWSMATNTVIIDSNPVEE